MKKFITVLAFLTFATGIKAQQPDTTKNRSQKQTSADSLLNVLGPENKKEDILPAFKATRLIISQTTTTVKKNNLNVLIIHRFGDMATPTTGARTLYGLDQINDVYLGFEYGITDNLNVDFGRSLIGGLVEWSLKYAILHQKADNSPPLAITLFGQYGVRPYGDFPNYASRQSYLGQAIVSSRITSAFSLLVSPAYVYDYTPIPDVPGNDKGLFALPIGARYKIGKHMSIVADYEHSFSPYRTGANGFSDPFAFGVEIETGGHVFTLNISNGRSISEINAFSSTMADYGRGEFRLGFTISRMFSFNKNAGGYKTEDNK
jgi:hypothetical protein